MADIAKMYELQKLDLTWEKVRRRLGQIKSMLVENDELRALRQRTAATETELHRLQTQQTNAELESASLASRITATEQRLMGGQVRNPKELESLQANVEALKRQRATVDGEGVEALLKAEEVNARLAQERANLQQVEEKWRAGQSELTEEETKMKRAYAQLKKQRESAAAALGSEQLKRYEDLRQRKAGVAIAVIQHNMCGACHVQVPTGVVSAARNPEANVALCPSCGRILYAG
ncbi:MAG: C4-type zinc ribbon domain-containing protein [Caldilineaceae bacterium]